MVELKATAFKPDYLGQLGMYLAVVDDTFTHGDDQPTIGLLLCKTNNAVAAEYALRKHHRTDRRRRMGHSHHQLVAGRPQVHLPSIEEIEAELATRPEEESVDD